MTEIRVHSIAMSLDGYVAGPDQDVDHPLGVGAEVLHEWVFATRTGRVMIGQSGGSEGVDDRFLARGFEGIGATVMGRNMFGPIRGSWATPEGEAWRGWWGPEPPFHHPVFVLTHHPHEPIEMEGGTTFFFVTDGVDAALDRARAAAGPLDIRVGGGAETLREHLRAGLVDHLHVAVVPILLGAGERIFDDLGAAVERYACVDVTPGEAVTHVRFRRR